MRQKQSHLEFTPGGFPILRKLFLQTGIHKRTNPHSDVLLIGVRNYETANRIAQEFDARVVGIDEDAEAIIAAKETASRHPEGSHAAFKVMSPMEIDFPAGSFDYVVCEGMLNVYPKSKLFRQIKKMLRGDGYLLAMEACWKQVSAPTSVRNVWEERSSPIPMFARWNDLMMNDGLVLESIEDISIELDSFYAQFRSPIHSIIQQNEGLSKMYKKLVTKYKHEIDVYLHHGGKKWMGYCALVARKGA